MKKIVSVTLSAALASSLYAAGYKIPEQSIKSVALAAAYVAGADEADAAYFNPANMSFMDEAQRFEIAFTGIYLPRVKYEGSQVVSTSPLTLRTANNESRSESFLVPHLHYISKPFGKWRIGLSLTTPAGLSKKWDQEPQSWSSREFTLRVVEFNPTLSYLLSDKLSVAAGIRTIFTDGKIKFTPPVPNTTNTYLNYDLDGDVQTAFGYNLAISYRYHETLNLAATFRSKVDLKEKGDATIDTIVNSTTVSTLSTKGRVTVPLPATLALAAALDLNEKAKIELTYERTFWSSYDKLVINFENASAYDIDKEKSWKDTNTFRMGLTFKNSDKLTTMYAIAYDQTPIPARTLGYELPDSDAYIFSLGALYRYSSDIGIGVAYLYDYKTEREIALADQNINGIVGKFSKGGAHLLNLSFNYRF